MYSLTTEKKNKFVWTVELGEGWVHYWVFLFKWIKAECIGYYVNKQAGLIWMHSASLPCMVFRLFICLQVQKSANRSIRLIFWSHNGGVYSLYCIVNWMEHRARCTWTALSSASGWNSKSGLKACRMSWCDLLCAILLIRSTAMINL